MDNKEDYNIVSDPDRDREQGGCIQGVINSLIMIFVGAAFIAIVLYIAGVL